MIHCVNCGAASAAAPCPSCGMDAGDAQAKFRQAFANRTAIFLVGALGFVVASGLYPPLEIDGMMIFVGIVFFITLGIGVWLERSAVRHMDIEALKKIYFGLVPVPLLLGVLLLVNGGLDHAAPTEERTTIVDKFSMRGPWPGHRLVVYSWRDGRLYERIAVNSSDFDLYTVGDPLMVSVESGLVGIPWAAGVYRREPGGAMHSQ
jgi:hypothetical protein